MDPVIRQLLTSQAQLVAQAQRDWLRNLAAIRADGVTTDSVSARERFIFHAAYRRMFGLLVAAADRATNNPRGPGNGAGLGRVFRFAEDLIAEARRELDPPPNLGEELCCWCGRGKRASDAQVPTPRTSDALSAHENELALSYHDSCWDVRLAEKQVTYAAGGSNPEPTD